MRSQWSSKNPLYPIATAILPDLLKSDRIVSPGTLRTRVIALAYDAHQGAKQGLRLVNCWPGMDAAVERTIRLCTVCQSADKSAETSVTPVQPVLLPLKPWEKLTMDAVEPFESAPQSRRFMVAVVNYYSFWPKVASASNVTATRFLFSYIEVTP